MGNYTEKLQSVEEMDSLHEELSGCLQDCLHHEDVDNIPSVEKRNKIKSDLLHPENYLAETDRVLFNDFMNSLTPSNRDDYYVITLNYTNTFEKLLSVQSILNERKMAVLFDICHIHGQLGDTIIIGVDNKDQIRNSKFRSSNEITSFLVKIEANAAMKNLRHSRCEKLIKEANLIVLFGVSYGETDMHWWKIIGDELKKRKDIGLINFLYCPGEIPDTRKYRLMAIEKRERTKLYSKMDITGEDDIDSRFFIVFNSSMFSKP